MNGGAQRGLSRGEKGGFCVVIFQQLDGLGSNPSGGEIFRPSRPALGPTQPPVQWVPGLSRGRGGRGVGLIPTPI